MLRTTKYPIRPYKGDNPALVAIFDRMGKKRYTIRSVEETARISKCTITKWRSGKNAPRFNELMKVLDVLELEMIVLPKAVDRKPDL